MYFHIYEPFGMKIKFSCVCIFAALLFACNENRRHTIIQDTSITSLTSFNNLFLDSLQLQKFIATHDDYKNFQQQYFDFLQATQLRICLV